MSVMQGLTAAGAKKAILVGSDGAVQTGGGGGGGGAVTVADGADATQGITTGAAVATDANGTLQGYLRGLVKWTAERMPAALGQALMAASIPVAIASNQSSIAVAATLAAAANIVGSIGGLGIMAAATPTVNASSSASSQGIAATGNLRLVGFSITETAGTPAVGQVTLRHGTSNTDPILCDVKLGASESTREWFGPDGIAVASGIYVHRVSGTSQVTLFTKAVA